MKGSNRIRNNFLSKQNKQITGVLCALIYSCLNGIISDPKKLETFAFNIWSINLGQALMENQTNKQTDNHTEDEKYEKEIRETRNKGHYASMNDNGCKKIIKAMSAI